MRRIECWIVNEHQCGIYAVKLCKCGAVVSGRCYKCTPQTYNKSFYSSHRWRVLSEAKRARDPLCEQCLAEGRTTAAEEVHHIKSVEQYPELKWDVDNLMSVCVVCHRKLDG